ASILEKYALANTTTLAQLPNRALTRIGGLVAAVQMGVSKKSNKPYAMLTLEDLEGSVQVLCMNENYGEDKPKLFPQEIMPLEDAPRKYTKQVHFRLHTAHLEPEKLAAVHEL